MFEKLLGVAQGFFGRSFLLAGLLPALALLLTAAAFRLPLSTFTTSIGTIANHQLAPAQKAAESKAQASVSHIPTEIIWSAILWIGLSGLFFAARGAVLRYFEDVPFPARLQFWLRARQERRRKVAFSRRIRAEFTCTHFYWLLNRLSERPQYCPSGYSPSDDKQLSRKSAAVRALLEKPRITAEFQSDGYLSKEDIDIVIEGVSSFYLLGLKSEGGGFSSEQAFWSILLSKPEVSEILKYVDAETTRRWVSTYQESNKYPAVRWIKPTTLGNKIEAIEEYAKSRYGIETSTLWSRTWWVLSEAEKESVASSKLAVQSLVNLSTSFLLAGLLIIVMAILGSIDALRGSEYGVNWRALAFIPACFLLSWSCYFAATSAVDGLRERLVTLLDLNRLPTLAKLGFAPGSFDQELTILSELRSYFVQAKPLGDSKAYYAPPRDQQKKE